MPNFSVFVFSYGKYAKKHASAAPADLPEKNVPPSDPDYEVWFHRQVAESLADMEAGRANFHKAMTTLMND